MIPASPQHGRDLVAAARVEVVVAENGADRGRQVAARVCEDERLVDLAVGGQVAREEDQVGLPVDGGERLLDPVAGRLGSVHVPGGCDRLPCVAMFHSRAGDGKPGGDDRMPMSSSPRLIETMKRAAAVLRRHRRPVRARRRARLLGARRPADRARRRLRPQAGGRRTGAAGARRGRHAHGDAARGLAAEGVRRRRPGRPDLRPAGRAGRRRAASTAPTSSRSTRCRSASRRSRT